MSAEEEAADLLTFQSASLLPDAFCLTQPIRDSGSVCTLE